MDSTKRLEKILRQLRILQKSFATLASELEHFKKEAPADAVSAQQLQQALARLEWERKDFRHDMLFGYARISPGRAELAERLKLKDIK